MKLYPIKRKDYYDNYEERITSQTLSWDYDDFKGRFHVHDMYDCPEDCIIGRDLFTADDFLYAIRLGMALAQKGYDNILELTED